MIKRLRTSAVALTGASALVLSSLEAIGHPGSHIGASHSHFFSGAGVLLLLALAGATAKLLFDRKRKREVAVTG